MNYPGEGPPSPPLPSPARRDLQLQGPRPTPLKVSKTSHQIRKPPPHPHLHRPPPPPPQHPGEFAGEDSLRRDPVIIYTVSPKIINATAGEFMSIVQRLTGPNPPSPCAGAGAGDVSPAARLATIEKTSPSESSRADWVVEVGQFPPGVLSPAPGSLPPVPAGFFSTAPDPHAHSWASDLGSPMWHNIFVASPSSNILISPGPPSSSSFDIFNLFDL